MKKSILLMLFLGAGGILFARGGSEKSKTVTIELEGNPTTGYSWTYTQAPEGVIRELSRDYRQKKEGLAGSGGVFTFVFVSVSPGETILTFSYSRPWEEGKEPAQSLRYALKAQTDGTLTAEKLP